ncbi:hypothetical protein C8Q78DRAFT_324252 [Trametes maxima]|nr:hypothetical protein C8Q78DRAFT_324252 [Trametes maxima]
MFLLACQCSLSCLPSLGHNIAILRDVSTDPREEHPHLSQGTSNGERSDCTRRTRTLIPIDSSAKLHRQTIRCDAGPLPLSEVHRPMNTHATHKLDKREVAMAMAMAG